MIGHRARLPRTRSSLVRSPPITVLSAAGIVGPQEPEPLPAEHRAVDPEVSWCHGRVNPTI